MPLHARVGVLVVAVWSVAGNASTFEKAQAIAVVRGRK
jgi:hypothetical protein